MQYIQSRFFEHLRVAIRMAVLGCGCWWLLCGLAGCNVTKTFGENQTLLRSNKVVLKSRVKMELSDKEKLKEDLLNIAAQKPNKRVFGMPLKMWLYISANKGKETRFKWWIKNKVGEPPVFFDADIADKSDKLMENYLFNYGFFDGDAAHEAVANKKKRTKVTYTITTGTLWKFGKIAFPKGDKESELLIARNTKNTLLKTGSRFDVTKMKAERERIETDLRNNGYYYFSRDYITFDMDSQSATHTVDFQVKLNQPTDTTQHAQYKIGDVYIISDYRTDVNADTLKRDTIFFRDYIFLQHGRAALNKKVLLEAIFIHPDQLYKKENELRTLRRLTDYSTFRFVSIDFVKSKRCDGNCLDCIINLAPAKRQTVSAGAELNVSTEGLLGTSVSLNYKNRNLSHNADQLVVNASAGIQTQIFRVEKAQLISTDVSAEVTYYLNKFLVPFKRKNVMATNNPRTLFNTRYSFENRYDFDTTGARVFLYTLHNAGFQFGYEWTEKRFMRHRMNPIGLSFYLLPKTGAVFEQRLDSFPSLRSSFEEQIILGPGYTFIFSDQQGKDDRQFMDLRVSSEAAGNLLYAGFKLGNLKSKHDSVYEIFKRPFSQYVRVEADWRNYFRLNRHSLFAIRTFIGLGITYGNSSNMPFVKQFFVGGPNSLRGFLIREIGPGSYYNSATFDPDTGTIRDISFFNQAGDVKLELNAELRFDIWRWIKGALFADAGNVWALRPQENLPLSNFSFGRFWKEFAVDVGAGLRLDFSYFVLRFDYGFPLRDPRYRDGKRWLFAPERFDRGQFQLAVGYPF